MESNFNSESAIKVPSPAQYQSWVTKKKEEQHGYPIGNQALEAERSDLAGITKAYLDLSTVHGLR